MAEVDEMLQMHQVVDLVKADIKELEMRDVGEGGVEGAEVVAAEHGDAK